MSRVLHATLLVAAAAQAQTQPSYERIIDEAVRLERELRLGESPDVPFDRAYRKLAEAAQLEPGRWEAFAMRGVNRCTAAVVCRQRLTELLAEARARGEPAESLRSKEDAGLYYIDQLVAAAQHDFGVMRRNMQKRREVDPGRLRFASAALKFARAEYLKSATGAGAIDDFKALVKAGWNPERCSEFVARCYLELGNAASANEEYQEAQRHWDHALEWVQTDSTKRIILTNKAAAYDLDNEFGLAEQIVRRQIEMEPDQPIHWKNLGLMLGHQNMLRAALPAYARTRELCRKSTAPIPPAYFHGNAWLKPAMIHGKLLEDDGDLLLAWRLFLEYRGMLGDDYNFCVNFGEFAFHMGQYDLAWTYLVRARDLQPFCIMPYQLLLMTALRMEGTPEEVRARIEKARADHSEAMRHFRPRDETPGLRRLCAGLSERTGPVNEEGTGPATRLEPDPLAGYDPEHAPPWIEEAAALRQPFDPNRPEEVVLETAPAKPAEEPAPVEPPRNLRHWFVSAGLLVAAFVVCLVVLRRRRTSA